MERSLIGAAERFLTKQILGDPRSDDPFEQQGLRLDDALALEAKYYGLTTDRVGAPPRDALGAESPLSSTELWRQDGVRRYAQKKIAMALAKAEPLTRFHPEAKSMLAHADMLLVGLHSQLSAGAFGEALDEATHGKSANVIDDWRDPDRMVLYRSILGVPLYCFPHVNEEMKEAYRRFQAEKDKGWPLHIDHHWETLGDLDPDEKKRAMDAAAQRARLGVTALALGVARGQVLRGDEGLALDLPELETRIALGGTVGEAADRLMGLEQTKPSIYDSTVAPLATDARKVKGSKVLTAEIAATVAEWKKRAMQLEVMDTRDAVEEAEYLALREATKLLEG
ncbi:MAG: hypothetical protein R3B82_16370 [Sandaracinaceae bacterium]